MSRVTTRAARIVRFIRLIRLIRVGKLYKHAFEAINEKVEEKFQGDLMDDLQLEEEDEKEKKKKRLIDNYDNNNNQVLFLHIYSPYNLSLWRIMIYI